MSPPVFTTAAETGAPRSGSCRASENDITTSSRRLAVNGRGVPRARRRDDGG